MVTGARRRRHGKELESSILVCGWDELVEVGYGRLTVGSIAARAGTSEPVLYRRWANKDALVLAAIEHRRNTRPIDVPDTGGLRGDLLTYLTAVSQARAAYFAIVVAAAFSGLVAATGMSLAQIRERFMGEESEPHRRLIYQRAHQRGELDPQRVPAALLAMPFDLVRHDLLMDLGPPPPERIRSIVDELFLPLLRTHLGRAVS